MANKLLPLSLTKDLRRLLQKGQTFKEGGLLIKYLPNKGQNLRVAFSLPKTKIKRAVDRNKTKRQLKELLRKGLEPNLLGLDVFIKLNKEIQSYDKLKVIFKKWKNQLR